MATDMRFPLPHDQLPRVQIAPQTIAQWKAEAQDAISRVMMDTHSWFYRFDEYDPSFTRSYDKNGSRGYMRVLPGTNVVEYLSQSELHMTLEDVIYSTYCCTTQQQRAVHAQLYQDTCLDSAILELYERATPTDPFNRVALLWTALCPKLPSAPLKWSLSAARDYVYFDISYTTKDAGGRTVLVHYRKSQDLGPDQLVQDHSLSINRRCTHAMSTFSLHDGDRLAMTSWGRIALESTFSALSFKVILPVLFNRELNHMELVAVRNLQLLGITAATLAEKNPAPASMCRVCHKGFGLIRKRTWCRACGHAICRSCYMKIALLKDGLLAGPSLPILKARICQRCLLHASEQRIKSELTHECMLGGAQHSRVQWWESINVVDEISIDGLHQRNGARSSAATSSSVSSSDSGLLDELGLGNRETLARVAATVAEHTAHLRQKRQARLLRNETECDTLRPSA